MKFTTKYNIEDIVYLVTDNEQLQRIILSITVYPNNLFMYEVANGTDISEHYEFELCENENVILKTTN